MFLLIFYVLLVHADEVLAGRKAVEMAAIYVAGMIILIAL